MKGKLFMIRNRELDLGCKIRGARCSSNKLVVARQEDLVSRIEQWSLLCNLRQICTARCLQRYGMVRRTGLERIGKKRVRANVFAFFSIELHDHIIYQYGQFQNQSHDKF